MINNSNFLIILVGLPASGKSVFAVKLKSKLESKFPNEVKIIDPDIIRDSVSPNNFIFKNEPQIREKNLETIRKHLNDGLIVISDDLNYYSSMRHDLKLIADSFKVKFYIIHISTPLKLCLRRNEERGKPIPNKVIKKIYAKFDDFNKYKWDSPFGTFNINQSGDITQFIEMLSDNIALNLKKLDNIEEHLRIKSSISKKHELDLISRKYVGELLKNPKYYSSKKAILEYRKSFIKSRSIEELNFNKFLEDFKIYLDEKLKV